MPPMDEGLLDDIIARLLAAKSGRGATKTVQLTEAEIRQLCVVSKEIFLSQPNLLELEAPIKICGNKFEILIRIWVLILKMMIFLDLSTSLGYREAKASLTSKKKRKKKNL